MTDNAPDDQLDVPIDVLERLPVDAPKAEPGTGAFADGDTNPEPVPDGRPGA